MQPAYCNRYYRNNFQSVGFQGQILDVVNGITPYTIGDITGTLSATNIVGSPTYWKGSLSTWLNGQTGADGRLFATSFVHSFKLGQALTCGLDIASSFQLLTSEPNQAIPGPLADSNEVTPLGNLLWYNKPASAVRYLNPVTAAISAEIVATVSINASYTAGYYYRVGGLDYVYRNPHSFNQTDPRLTVTSQWPLAGVDYAPAYINPPGDLDVQSLLAGNALTPNYTYSGLAYIYQTTQTVEGKTSPGGMVLVSPDYSGYYIFQFVPTDTPAQSWYNFQSGNVATKIDNYGAIWLKNVTNPNKLFVTAGTLSRLLPVFPPIALPKPPMDTEEQLKMYREVGAKT